MSLNGEVSFIQERFHDYTTVQYSFCYGKHSLFGSLCLDVSLVSLIHRPQGWCSFIASSCSKASDSLTAGWWLQRVCFWRVKWRRHPRSARTFSRRSEATSLMCSLPSLVRIPRYHFRVHAMQLACSQSTVYQLQLELGHLQHCAMGSLHSISSIYSCSGIVVQCNAVALPLDFSLSPA